MQATESSRNAIRGRQVRRRGFTLIELLLAMAGTALVATAIASIGFAVAHDTESSRDLRVVVGEHGLLTTRLDAAIHSSRMVLDKGTGFLVLWMADTKSNDAPDLSEIRMLEHDAINEELSSYRAPSSLAAGDDTAYDFSDNFKTLLDTIKGGSNFPETLWGADVSAWSVEVNNANEQLARLVSYRITLQKGSLADTLVGASSLESR